MSRRPSQHPDAVRARRSRAARRERGTPLPADADAAIVQAVPKLLVDAGFRRGLASAGARHHQMTTTDIVAAALDLLMRREREDGAPRYDRASAAAAIAARLRVTERHL